METIANPTNDLRVAAKLFKKIVFPILGVPKVLISDSRSHFIENKLETFLKNYEVHHKYRCDYQPQTSGC